jgi:bifunctional non-homologous end joining protein LigD
MGGVLASWAVPKGPTLDPKVRRMAVHVEDHPVDYFDFEGVIPKGEYGGGDVIVWDWGTWDLVRGDDPVAAVEAGDLHFALHGEKLNGRFVLVKSKRQQGSRDNQWLLLHKADEFAVAGWEAEDHPTSVLSGRTNDEVAADPDALWHSNRDGDGEVVEGRGGLEVLVKEAGKVPPATTIDADLPAFDATPPTADELAALDEMGNKGGPWTFGGQEIKVTNLDKVLFPADGDRAEVTKRDLIRYHACIAPTMLPYLAGRPVNMNRFPDGVAKKGFWHKSADQAPPWISRYTYEERREGDTEVYVVLDSAASLVWAAQYAAVELNPWTSRTRDSQEPTWAMIDIDPGTSSTFDDVLVAARLYRTALDHFGVVGCPKVTGKRGVQIWVPVARGYTFEDTRDFVDAISRAIGQTIPDLVSWEWAKKERGGRMRLDYTQNAVNKTLVAPFSARPVAGAPVSVPIAWDELDDGGLRPDAWDIRTVVDRVAEAGDPLRPLVGLQQQLPTV